VNVSGVPGLSFTGVCCLTFAASQAFLALHAAGV